jgi:hypothetical protein
MDNFGMPLENPVHYKNGLRNRPSKYAQSPLRPFDFEQSEGVRPSEIFAPYKYLPVAFQDVNTQDYVVLPKGRIVASATVRDTSLASGLVNPSSSGWLNIGTQAVELGGATIKVPQDTSFFGYDEYINGLLVPANGGTTFSGFYSASDVAATTMLATGSVVASGGTPFVNPANAPIGVVFHDWYQDIRGKYLNYNMNSAYGNVLTDWYIQVPFVIVSNSTYSGVAPQAVTSNYAHSVKWFDVNSQFTYLTVDSTASDVFRAGVFVTSDLIGNYKIQGGSSALTQSATVQTVGKIIGIDSRFPKSGLEDVVTYPGSVMPGTQTAGMPKYLFDFTKKCLEIGLGTTVTVEDVYNAIRSGSFGYARIQLQVS